MREKFAIDSQLIWRSYLIYLGLLPALATFGVLRLYGSRVPFWLIFLGGTVAVSVYLAVAVGYARGPSTWWRLLWVLADGPIFVLISLLQGENGRFLYFFVESFFVDGLAIFGAILVLAVLSPLPTRGQRAGSIFFMLLAVVFVVAVFGEYLAAQVWGHGLRLFWLMVGLVESAVVNYFLLKRDEATDPTNFSTLYIAGMVMLWVFLAMAGNVSSGT